VSLAPSTTAEQRALAWRFLALQSKGLVVAVERAVEHGTYKEAMEAVRYSQFITDQMRGLAEAMPDATPTSSVDATRMALQQTQAAVASMGEHLRGLQDVMRSHIEALRRGA